MGVWGEVRRLLPRTVSGRMFLLSLLVIAVPIGLSSWLLEREGRSALLQEKAEKLYGLARLLDAELGDAFAGTETAAPADPQSRAARVAGLNARLAATTDRVAAAHPGVGVGYYNRALDAIVTYGPSGLYGHTVGTAIAPDHPGRRVMASGTPAVETGPQVRGTIMNAMWPILRGGEVRGYIWANELSDEVERQAASMDRAILLVGGAGILLGLLASRTIARGLARDIRTVTDGLARLRSDLRHTVPPPPGEIGAIADEVNGMARALLEARTLTENILNSLADGVIAVDPAQRVTAINPAAQRMLGTAAGTALGRPYATLFKEERTAWSALLDTLRSGREHVGAEIDCPLPDRTLHLSASSSLLRDSRGAPIGAVVVLKDQTEQRRLATQVMRADRLAALGELVAGVAHEIRNPLTSIRGFMQYLEDCDDPAEWREYAPLIVRQVDGLNRIVSELLEFGRPRPPSLRRVDLNGLVADVARLAGGKQGVTVTCALAADLPPLEADAEALKQALLNLLINALQALPDGGSVRIATAAGPAGGSEVSVSDDGIGIAPENLEKVFDPFFSTKPSGTGLGLAMVHRILDAHGGSVAIDSTPGAGTTVVLRLPAPPTSPPAGEDAA